MVALLEEYNPRPAKTDLPAKKCSTANFLETSNRVENLLSSAQDLCLVKEGCAYETASGHSYGPFGELVNESGSYSTMNTYKFSTKPQDEETGYYYYGFRYYDTSNGRWLNRDPIEEIGGTNIYVFVRNEPTFNIDILGMHCKDCPGIHKSCLAKNVQRFLKCMTQAMLVERQIIQQARSAYNSSIGVARSLMNKVKSNCERLYRGNQSDIDSCKSSAQTAFDATTKALKQVFDAAAAAAAVKRAVHEGSCRADKALFDAACDADKAICDSGYGKDDKGCPCK
tara:strand:- start:732 stop:1580 length:849 start_codon:yes stop_codon:yes gene_type:complete